MNPREIREEAARLERIDRAADDIQSDPEIADKVVDGLVEDLAKPRRITATRLQQRIICECGSPRVIRVLEVVPNEDDGGILTAEDATGEVWACAMDTDQLQDRLFGLTLPE